jgi:iron-sulfur cluster insertion protein
MSETQFSVSPTAAKRIAFLASKEAKPVMMRVAVLRLSSMRPLSSS